MRIRAAYHCSRGGVIRLADQIEQRYLPDSRTRSQGKTIIKVIGLRAEPADLIAIKTIQTASPASRADSIRRATHWSVQETEGTP